MAAGDVALGFVVNPKLKRPVFVLAPDRNDVKIFRVDGEEWEEEGAGYFSRDDEESAEATGYPRVHTPDGVENKGAGYGTALYTGLCLAAHLGSEGRFRMSASLEGDGISSKEGERSHEADRWWSQAKRLRLASFVESEREEENVELDVSGPDLENCVSIDGTITYIHRLEVDITKSISGDAYPYSSAVDKNLIAAALVWRLGEARAPTPEEFADQILEGKQPKPPPAPEPEDLWRALMQEPDKIIDEANTDVILALDVRGISKEAMNALGLLLQWGGR